MKSDISKVTRTTESVNAGRFSNLETVFASMGVVSIFVLLISLAFTDAIGMKVAGLGYLLFLIACGGSFIYEGVYLKGQNDEKRHIKGN